MTPNQKKRQRYRGRGQYAKVNPCYACGQSAGVDYCSHKDTDHTIHDELLCLCRRCAKATQDMPGPEAVEWAKRTYWDKKRLLAAAPDAKERGEVGP